jgi:hypothetical protein
VGSDPHALVRAQVVRKVADEDVRHFADSATGLGAVVSAARVPLVLPKDVDFAGNVAEAQSSARNDGNGVLSVVDAPKVV